MTEVFDVAIVGAGISGLSAAYHLHGLWEASKQTSRKLRIKVVDARDKIGGRIQKLPAGNLGFGNTLDLDMGGQDLFFDNHDGYKNLLQPENKTSLTGPTDWDDFVAAYPPVIYDDCATCAGAVSNRICTDINPIRGCTSDSGERWVPDIRNSLDTREASFKDASLATFVETFLYEPLLHKTDKVEVQFEMNRQITAISTTRRVIVKGGGGRIRADQVVVAVPATALVGGKRRCGNLQERKLDVPTIKFEPASAKFPFKQQFDAALRSINIPKNVRVWLSFTDDFYDDVTDFEPDERKRLWNSVRGYTNPGNYNIVSTQGNRDDRQICKLSDEEICDRTKDEITEAYGVNRDYIGCEVMNWGNEKHIWMGGSYDVVENLAEPGKKVGHIKEKVWFAGDYYRNGYCSDNPAGESGREAACEIFKKLCPGCSVDPRVCDANANCR